MVNFALIIIIFHMGQYLETSGQSVSKNEETRRLINSLRDKLSVEVLFQSFGYYMQDCYPEEDMTW